MVFSGVRAVICSEGLTEHEHAVLCENLDLYDGVVVQPNAPVASLFLLGSNKRKREDAVLPSGTTHVLCDSRPSSAAAAAKTLGVSSLSSLASSTVNVLSSRWITDCINKDKLLAVDDYIIKDAPASAAAAAAAAAAVAPSAAAAAAAPAVPAAKLSVQSSSTTATLPAAATLTALAAPPQYTDTNAAASWEDLFDGSVMRRSPAVHRCSTHILALDLDGTMIESRPTGRSGGPRESSTQCLPKVVSTVQQWHAAGYRIAIISNQVRALTPSQDDQATLVAYFCTDASRRCCHYSVSAGIEKGYITHQQTRQRLDAVVAQLGVPCEVLLSLRDDNYRKPRIGCWELLVSSNEPSQPVLSECMHVGDAAGRPKEGTAKKDFSACDLKLAINARISFATPEQFFSGSKQPRHCDRRRALLGPSPYELLPPAAAATTAGDAAAAVAAAAAAEVARSSSAVASAAGAANVGSSSNRSSSGVSSSVQFAPVVDLTDEATDSATMKATAAEIASDSTSSGTSSTFAAAAASAS
eukprot:19669-Heterococcus_DN1.PRE.2